MKRIVVTMLKEIEVYNTRNENNELKKTVKYNPQSGGRWFRPDNLARYATPNEVSKRWNRVLGGTDSLRRSLNTLVENGFVERRYSGLDEYKTGRIRCSLTEKGREKALEFKRQAMEYIHLWGPIVTSIHHHTFNPHSTKQ